MSTIDFTKVILQILQIDGSFHHFIPIPFKNTDSCSKKGCPYDNAVAEATYKVLKTEFAFNRIFRDLEELERELFDYVNWYNNIRIHGSLCYRIPAEYRQAVL